MKPQKIEKEKIILAEGMDVKMFCIWAYQAYNLENIEVHDFGGISKLTNYLNILTLSPGFDKVKTIVVVRDAETDAEGAIKSIQKSFKDANLPNPSSPYKFTNVNHDPKTAFAILPGENIDNNPIKYKNGTLEDLCLSIIKDSDKLPCVENFLLAANACGCDLNHIHKSKLHAYLSIQNDYVGMKIGEAAKANAWDWNHSIMDKFRKLLSDM